MLQRILNEIIDLKLSPSLECSIVREGDCCFTFRAPHSSPNVYDTASITKPLITYQILRNTGYNLNTSLSEFYNIEDVSLTLRDLIKHTSGLKPWAPLYLYEKSTVETILNFPKTEKGHRVYSCLNYILLKHILEWITGVPFKKQVETFISQFPGTCLPPGPAENVQPTEMGNRHEMALAASFFQHPDPSMFRLNHLIHGETHDLNAYYEGGISGNSGLFSTLEGVVSLTQSLMEKPGFSESLFETDSYWYHMGFTGTGFAISKNTGTLCVILSNRVCPSVKQIDFSEVRHRVFRKGMEY